MVIDLSLTTRQSVLQHKCHLFSYFKESIEHTPESQSFHSIYKEQEEAQQQNVVLALQNSRKCIVLAANIIAGGKEHNR
jgi:hypothetical protein